ncbi:hypothetical protein DTO164E3_725 [Paecilomyces variotii]|uniref:Cytochrome b5-like heme/steroid binding domain-containing protein n=1 Tax=Byssochlamys spectabilis TaxID=264951 RepID=A0A443HQE3_BYSSP|nr:cytochrome b5-like heme/steroid binding domain-containing protein [Paecilomyces variotii]KAJ9200901.1 hypothetical protein DTO032I3_4375 [Paecilomyces variotii]KAJ9206484.1 hypothetical protein DTO164E3_725 [Paecilomyces variotii]KAJ9220140.1 hypothetical protein DTO169C6_7559 [Paecilomyces variotii]KAJ9230468.1 hypothetical protein DTO169E5_8431 [Paecilomyces variotii]KAJ9249056.1 hypothetical protein DTO207G8_6983 [Paecilomyces variotii]
MSELRQRPVPRDSKAESTSVPKAKRGDKDSEGGISLLDVIRVIVTLVVGSCALSYFVTSSESFLWGYRPWFTRWPVVLSYLRGPVLLNPEQLSLYNGTDTSLPIYVAVNGTIFDVSANPVVYGPGGSYNFFAGRDATRAFVTGCFKEDLTPDLEGVEEMYIPIDDPEEDAKLSSRERKLQREQDVRKAKAMVKAQVQHWENFFRNHKKYFEVGKVIDVPPKAPGEGKRELCEAAKRARTKRGEQAKGRQRNQ